MSGESILDAVQDTEAFVAANDDFVMAVFRGSHELTVRYGAVRCGAVRYGAVRCGTVRYGAVRCGAVRYGAVRYVATAPAVDKCRVLSCHAGERDGVSLTTRRNEALRSLRNV